MKPAIDVMICTCKRSELLHATLLSIARQTYPLDLIRVIVVDNDPNESAKDVVLHFSTNTGSPLKVEYFTEPEKNISKARNKAMAQTTANLVAFIDDDETASETWLEVMQQLISSRSGITAVMGPVLPIYEVDEPRWIIEAGLFERKRFSTGTEIPPQELRTGNVLLDMTLVHKNIIKFDETLGLSGGEDSMFFKTLKAHSANYIWCDEAEVSELVPKERISAKWLLRRTFRIGSVEATLAKKSKKIKFQSYLVAKIFYLLLMGFLGFVFSLRKSVKFLAVRKVAIASGIVYGFLVGPFNEYNK